MSTAGTMAGVDPLALHRALVAIPSVSGNEADCADFVQRSLERPGIEVERIGDNVVARRGRTSTGTW